MAGGTFRFARAVNESRFASLKAKRTEKPPYASIRLNRVVASPKNDWIGGVGNDILVGSEGNDYIRHSFTPSVDCRHCQETFEYLGRISTGGTS